MSYGLQQETVNRICSVFSEYPQVEEAILYGSRAKGTYKESSDVDLTLKGADLDMPVLNRIDSDLDDLLLPWTFDLSIYSQIENEALVDHINRVGVAFYRCKKKV